MNNSSHIYLPTMVSWDEKGSISVPETPPRVRPKVLVTHDESTFMAMSEDKGIARSDAGDKGIAYLLEGILPIPFRAPTPSRS